MLTQLRNHVHGFLAKALLLFLVITFGVWGIGDMLRGNARSDVATVGDARISIAEFQQSLQNTRRMAEAAGMKQIPPQLLQAQVLRQLIQQHLIAQESQRLHLVVGDAQLATELRSIEALRNVDGTFDAKAFHRYLVNQRISEAEFLARLKADMKAQTLAQTLGTDDMVLPSNVMALKALAAGETRDVMLITIPSAPGAEPTAQEISDFYEQQKTLRYMGQETRTLTYAIISDADIKAHIAKANGDRDAAMQTIAHSIEDALAAGRSLDNALADAGLNGSIKTLQDTALNGHKDAVVAKIVARGFSLEQGETSNLEVAKPGSYFVVSATNIHRGQAKPLDAVKADIIAALKHESAEAAGKAKAGAFAQAVKKSGDWKAAMAAEKLTGTPIRNVTREGKSTMPASLQQAVFERGLNEVAGPMLTSNGQLALAITTAIHHKRAVPFDTATTANIRRDLQRDVENHYFTHLANTYRINVNEALLASMRESTNE